MNFKKFGLVLAFIAFFTFLGILAKNYSDSLGVPNKPKNIILLIGDGMGPATIKSYRMYKDDPLTRQVETTFLDSLFVGSLRTDPLGPKVSTDLATQVNPHDLYGNITDSAASATAYATGKKALNAAISVTPSGEAIPTVLEKAKELGKSIGLVVTSQVNDATPSAFIAHNESRRNYDEIADQFIDNQYKGKPYIDVLLGGGTKFFVREDRNIPQEFAKLGYQYVDNKQAMQASDSDQLIGLFAPVGMSKMIDREDSSPSLSEMTEVALDKLSKNDNGFFLMVEGSQIDWAAHRNDIVGVMSEMQDFEDSIKLAVDFAKEHSDTLVIITSDHPTGGLSVGGHYNKKTKYKWNVDALRAYTKTADGILKQAEITGDLLGAYQNATNLPISKLQKEALRKADTQNTLLCNQLITDIINQQSLTGWTTHGHTGEDVYLFAYGPYSDKLRGSWENTKIGQFIFSLLE